MPFNGSGTYTLPAGNPVTTGTTISSTVQNNTTSDIATALTNCITRDGQSTPSVNLPMGSKKFTGLAAGTSAGDSVRYEQVQYVLNVSGAGTSGQALLSNGSSAPSWGSPTVATKTWLSYTSTTTFTAPSAGTYRFYCFGAGGSAIYSAGSYVNSGAGGGCAFGDVTLTAGQVVTITISSGTVTLTSGATTIFTANKGGDATSSAGGTGGTASKDASVTNGGAYSGGNGGTVLAFSGIATGGSSGSPLGNGVNGLSVAISSQSAGGTGWGGVGTYAARNNGGGGISSAATYNYSGSSYSNSQGRPSYAAYTDPLIAPAFASGMMLDSGGFGAGGGGDRAISNNTYAGSGGFGAGGGATYNFAGNGGFGGSAGVGQINASQVGASGYGAGASIAMENAVHPTGTAGAAIVLVYY